MASGNTLLYILPRDNEPTLVNYATIDNRNIRPCLDFDDTVDEEAVFSCIMPQQYSDAIGITVITWMGSSDNQIIGNVAWELLLERAIPGSSDLDADNFTVSVAGNRFTQPSPIGTGQIASNAKMISSGSDMANIVAGDMFRLKVRRDADGTAQVDDMLGDAELFAIEIRET